MSHLGLILDILEFSLENPFIAPVIARAAWYWIDFNFGLKDSL